MIAHARTAVMDEEEEKPVGIACRRCGCRHLEWSIVIDGERRWGYSQSQHNSRRRVRYCRNCGARVVTSERIVGEPEQKNPPQP